MIDLPAIGRRLDIERRSLVVHGQSLEILPRVSRLASADGSYHSVISSSLTHETADAAIAEQAAHYRAMKVEAEWKVYGHDSPADLRDRLQRHGFEPGPCEAVLILDLHDPPAWVNKAPICPVVRVGNKDQVELFRLASEAIFRKNYDFTANELLSNIASGLTHHLGYIAMDGTVAVSVGRLYTHPHSVFGGLYGGGTLERYRGRGFYRAIVGARAQEAIRLGARYLIVDALPTSRPILEKLGFIHLTDTWPCTLKP